MKKMTTLGIAIAITIIGAVVEAINMQGKEEEVESVAMADGTRLDPRKLLEVKGKVDPQSQIKEYEGFTVSFNPSNRVADYAAWELLESETIGETGRSNKFWKDETVRHCPTKDDYKGSGYDRGHLCPAGDQKWSREAMHDCFSMANMAPQWPGLNSGAWNTLEQKCRAWAQRDSAIYIIAGPIFKDSDTETLPGTKIRIPSAFFKVLLAPYVNEPRAIGFIYPNQTSPGNMEYYAMPVDEVEKITGYDFFHALPDKLENELESTCDFKKWNLSKSKRASTYSR